jgi:Ca2+-binding RTX toxin-like protein
MTLRRLIPATVLAFALVAPAADAANVALFNDTTYVGNEESANMQSALVSQGHTVFTFTDETADGFTTALAGRDSLVIPDLAGGTNLHTALSGAAREVIRQFVADGGGLVISGHATGDEAAAFLNTVFNFDLSETAGAPSTKQADAAAATEFAAGPDTLPSNNSTSALEWPARPGDRQVYGAPGLATVAILYRGLGSVTYLGWDWFNSNPPSPGGQDGGWQGILNSAVFRPGVSVQDVGVLEGNAGVTAARFVLSIGAQPVSEEVRVTVEAGGGTALAGQDYVAPPPTVTIPRGQTQANLDVAVIGDTADEPDETFELRLIGAGGAGLARALALGTIGDDDPSPGRCRNRQDANDAGGTLNGTPFGDLLVGGPSKDVLNGGDGEDCLRARAGNDRLNGGDDDDSLSGEAGADRLSGGEGKDTESGGAGNDTISGGNGNDRLGGGPGNDKINGGQGLNSYSGGSGDDNIIAANGRRETIDCGSGKKDKVRADRQDVVKSCETVVRL